MPLIDLFCKKMPMPCLLRGLLERCFSAGRLDALFESHAREQYTRNLLFSTACDVLLQTVLRIHPSVHAAYQAGEDGLNVSATALYDKLRGVETGVSSALVRETARDLGQVQDALGVRREAWLPGHAIRILDGNCLEAGEKRLGVHRGVGGAALPGKSLVVMDPQRGLLTDVFPCEDGHAQERSLLDAVLATVQAGEVWLADRNFCTCGFLRGLHERGARALLRLHGGLPFAEAGEWGAGVETKDGQRIQERAIEVEGRRYRLVRVELAEPTRLSTWPPICRRRSTRSRWPRFTGKGGRWKRRFNTSKSILNRRSTPWPIRARPCSASAWRWWPIISSRSSWRPWTARNRNPFPGRSRPTTWAMK